MTLKGSEPQMVETPGRDGAVRRVPVRLYERAEMASQAILRRAPWLPQVPSAVRSIAAGEMSSRQRLAKLRALADRIGVAVAPDAACAQGCSDCCHIRVEVTRWEAEQIARERGLHMRAVRGSADEQDVFGRSCGFLSEGRCTIYEARPLACRLHHSIGPDATMCDPAVDPEASFVPSIDLRGFWAAYHMLMPASPTGDLSDFIEEAARLS